VIAPEIVSAKTFSALRKLTENFEGGISFRPVLRKLPLGAMFTSEPAVVAERKTGGARMFYTALIILNVVFLVTMAVLFDVTALQALGSQ
jgi:hypothetical protein